MNVIFNVSINNRGLLELKTAKLSDEDFQKLRALIWHTKRLVLNTKTKGWGTTLSFTIDDTYQNPPLEKVDL